MTIGNITQDDFVQLVAMLMCVANLVVWAYMMRQSKSLFMLPAILASAFTLLFYFAIIFIPMSIQTATIFSSATRLTDLWMWLLSGGAMIYLRRRRQS